MKPRFRFKKIHRHDEEYMGPFKKYVTQGGWVGVVIFVTMRYEKYGGGGSKCDALRNANEKIENALINIVSPKNEWCNRCFGVPQCLAKA